MWTAQAQQINRLTGPEAKNQKYFSIQKRSGRVEAKIVKGTSVPITRKTKKIRRTHFQTQARTDRSYSYRRLHAKGPRAKNLKPWKQ